jgi:hypothetical protein
MIYTIILGNYLSLPIARSIYYKRVFNRFLFPIYRP